MENKTAVFFVPYYPQTTEKEVISEQGFEVRRMKKPDIKRFLALYFEASMNGEQMPDVDGAQFYQLEEE